VRLKHLSFEKMTNRTLRERFGLGDGPTVVASQVIAATIEAGLIRPDEAVGGSKKYARYLPFWA
jgi:ATP-dependent DNA helicase RecG